MKIARFGHFGIRHLGIPPRVQSIGKIFFVFGWSFTVFAGIFLAGLFFDSIFVDYNLFFFRVFHFFNKKWNETCNPAFQKLVMWKWSIYDRRQVRLFWRGKKKQAALRDSEKPLNMVKTLKITHSQSENLFDCNPESVCWIRFRCLILMVRFRWFVEALVFVVKIQRFDVGYI